MCRGVCSLAWHRMTVMKDMTSRVSVLSHRISKHTQKREAWRHGGCGGGGTTTCAEVVTSPRFPPPALCCGLKRERIRINPWSKPRTLQVEPSEVSCEWACRTTAYAVLPQQLTINRRSISAVRNDTIIAKVRSEASPVSAGSSPGALSVLTCTNQNTFLPCCQDVCGMRAHPGRGGA